MSDEVSAFESIPPARTLPTDLPPEQITFLKIVSLPMITGGKAAPWEWVLDHCEDEDLDAEQILKKLPRIGVSGKSYGFTTPKTTSLEGREEIRPTVAASLILPDLRAALGESFIRVLRYMVELYQNRPRSVTVANSVAVVFPVLMAAFPLVMCRVGGPVAVVTCRVVARVEVVDAVGRGAAGTA